MRRKEIGWGTSSIVLLLMGIVWCSTINELCLGDVILGSINVASWSKGTTGFHIGILYSLIFFIPSWIIASKYIDDWGTRAVRIISFFLSTFILIVGVDYFLNL